MGDWRDGAECKACQEDLLLQSANSPNLYDRCVANDLGIGGPTGERYCWSGQHPHRLLNKLWNAIFTGDTKHDSRMDATPEELTLEMVHGIVIEVMH